MQTVLMLILVAGNLVAFAEWVAFGGAASAGDATGMYGSFYRFTAAMLPVLLVMLVVDIGGVLWGVLAAATKVRSPFNRFALLAALPWVVAVALVMVRR